MVYSSVPLRWTRQHSAGLEWSPEGFCFLTEQGFCLSQRNWVHKLRSILDLSLRPAIPALTRQKQEFDDSQGYAEKTCLRNKLSKQQKQARKGKGEL